MKKSKFIIIGVVVALLLVGGAYAAWTSQTELTVNASSGELDVEISDVSVDEVSDYVEFDSKSIEISEDKKSASVSIENLYPGAVATAIFEITNTGTMPVALDKAVQKTIKVIDTETNKSVSNSVMSSLEMEYNCYVVNEKGKVVARIGKTSVKGNQSTATMFNNNKAVIQVGEKVILEMTISMDKKADEKVENKLVEFSITPFFVQGA